MLMISATYLDEYMLYKLDLYSGYSFHINVTNEIIPEYILIASLKQEGNETELCSCNFNYPSTPGKFKVVRTLQSYLGKNTLKHN